MGLTNFPNGITSFGNPVIGQPNQWLPKGASVYFVSPPLSAAPGSNGGGGATGSYDLPFRTLQYAVNKVTAGSSTSQGAMIYANPGEYQEQVTIADQRGINIIGSGIGSSKLDLTGVTATNVTGLAQGQTSGPPALVIASRNCSVTGFTFKVILNTYGIYLGDGTHFNAAYNYVCQDNKIFGNLFDGDSWAGLYGVLIDGAKNCWMYGANEFFRLGGGGVWIGSGVNEPTLGGGMYGNYVTASRGYGVRIASGTDVHNWTTGPFNVFQDDPTTALTNPANYGVTTGKNAYVGNFQACANDFSLQSTDYQSGNFKATAGNTVNYVSVA